MKVDRVRAINRSTGAAMSQAMRWARRVARAQSAADKQRCVRRTVDALLSALPPKVDGTHPLDAGHLKLVG